IGGMAAGSSALLVERLKPQPARLVPLTLGSARLDVSSGYLHNPAQLVGGSVERIDMALSWPEMEPVEAERGFPGPVIAEMAARAVAAHPSLGDVALVSMVPSDSSPAPETRVTSLYARFLEPAVQVGPGELLMRH